MLKTYNETRLIRAEPGPNARPTLFQAVYTGKGIGAKFANDLRALSVPNTDAGRQAEAWLHQSATDVLDVMGESERYVGKLPRNMTLLQSIRGLKRVEADLSNAIAQMIVMRESIIEFVPEMREAFEGAESCEKLAAIGNG